MKNYFIMLAITAVSLFCSASVNAQSSQQLTPQERETKVDMKKPSANHKTMNDKKEMDKIDNHSKAAGKAAGSAIEKAAKEAKAAKQREDFKKKKEATKPSSK